MEKLTIEGLQAELEQANKRMEQYRAQRDAEMEAFRTRVAEVAAEYAKSNGWCEVVAEALAELGLEMPASTIEFEVVVRYTVRGESLQHWRLGGLPDVEWVMGSITADPDTLDMDSDWENVEVVESTITGIDSVQWAD